MTTPSPKPTPCQSCPCCAAYNIILTNLTSTNGIPDATIAAIIKAVYFDMGEYFDAVARVRNTRALWPYNNPRQAENPEERTREWEDMVAEFRESRKGSKWLNVMSLPPQYVRVGTGERGKGEFEIGHEVESERGVVGEQEREIVEEDEQEKEEVATTMQKQPMWTEVQVVQEKEQEPAEREQEPELRPEPRPEPEQIRTRFEASASVGGW
jgi:hypothetical protein